MGAGCQRNGCWSRRGGVLEKAVHILGRQLANCESPLGSAELRTAPRSCRFSDKANGHGLWVCVQADIVYPHHRQLVLLSPKGSLSRHDCLYFRQFCGFKVNEWTIAHEESRPLCQGESGPDDYRNVMNTSMIKFSWISDQSFQRYEPSGGKMPYLAELKNPSKISDPYPEADDFLNLIIILWSSS